ncbi:MAG: hypothetical protein QXX68_02080 [Candidatus Pacearchaeota archaeon]
MGALERYNQLKKEGKSENEIYQMLQEEGFSMAEINDAASQAAIKNAINSSNIQGYQESGSYNQENATGSYYNYDGGQQEQYAQYGQEYYQYPTYSEGFSADTTTEIVEQIVSKKMKELIEGMNSLKKENIYLAKEIENLKERLKRIEDSFDFLQKAIIGKIGQFEENSKIIQKDLDNIHGTMSKLMNPLIDTYNELKSYKEKVQKKSENSNKKEEEIKE